MHWLPLPVCSRRDELNICEPMGAMQASGVIQVNSERSTKLVPRGGLTLPPRRSAAVELHPCLSTPPWPLVQSRSPCPRRTTKMRTEMPCVRRPMSRPWSLYVSLKVTRPLMAKTHRNRVLKSTLAFVNSPSLSETTMNWLPLNLHNGRTPSASNSSTRGDPTRTDS